MTKLLLVDDHHLVRQGVRRLLESEPDFQVVGETGDGLEVIKLVQSLRPDVVVLDLNMPGLSGLEVIRQLSRHSSSACIVVLSMHTNESYVLEALRNGAMRYVLKDSTADHLVQAIRHVASGRRYLSPPLSELLIESYVQKADAAPLDPYETLTTREREVLHLIVNGHSSSEVALRLSISKRTVETYRTNIIRKLRLRNHADLLRYALKRGILTMDS